MIDAIIVLLVAILVIMFVAAVRDGIRNGKRLQSKREPKATRILRALENRREFEKLQKLRHEMDTSDRRWDEISSNNNTGSIAEKSGDMDFAVRCYEENVGKRAPATHAYERLMIIYRRQKRYTDEIRVIKTALEVFGQENERRFKQAIETCRDQETLEAIKLARETCGTVRRPDGRVVYSPYPIMKWISRLSKAERLLHKSK